MFGHKKAKDEFEILFKENYNKLYVFAYNYLNDKEISEINSYNDVDQRILQYEDDYSFLKRNYDNLKNNSLVPVLFQQVRHRSFNYLRHNKIVEKYASVFIYTTSELEDTQENDDDERINRIMMIINTLPPKTRKVLEECYFNQKKYSEVAQMLNISTNTVKKHIMKALSSLREELSVSVNGKDS